MSKSILCAVDINETENEKDVLLTAAKLAKMDNARLDVMTVVPNFGMSIVGSFFDESFSKKAIDHSKDILNKFVESSVGPELNNQVRHVVTTGSVYEEILKVAKEAQSDLIIIGAHKPDLSEYLLGPNAARVVRHSTTSVYVVRT